MTRLVVVWAEKPRIDADDTSREVCGHGEPLRYRDMKEEIRRLYLKTGDQVMHRRYPQWGFGVVIEEWNSGVVGGMSYVRIIFRDGQTRVFDNNFANECCCYYAGLRRCED